MNFKERKDSFQKRFGVIEQSDEEKEMHKFKTRVLNIFDGIDCYTKDESIEKFCNYLGKKVNKEQIYSSFAKISSIQNGKNIISALKNESEKFSFYFLLEIIFTLEFTSYSDKRYGKNFLYKKLMEAIEISNIDLSISLINGEVVLHPRGEEKLDEVLLEETFGFLNSKANEHFLSALKSYNKRTPQEFIKSAESVRRCIEEFLRFKLKNEKGLAENIKELGSKLKNEKIAPQLRNKIVQIFSYMDEYFNENSKHKDGDIRETENEFLLYQAGLLMRYINRVI